MAKRNDMTQYEAAVKERIKVSAIMILIVIPIIIGAGYLFFGKKMYMIVSLLILICVMAPFFMVFEKRRPKAREIMLIAVMSALTVVIHMIFHIFLPIQVGTAMVIISGIALGPEAGFLIGALSRFITNFYMGQGLWTPWQMFCWGILGFLSGFIFMKTKEDIENEQKESLMEKFGPFMAMIFAIILGYICFLLFPGDDDSFFGWRVYLFGFIGLVTGFLMRRRKLSTNGLVMAIVTFVMTFVIYGGIMNFSTAVNSTNMVGGTELTVEGLKLLYISGLPFDLIHGLTAAICVFVIGDAMIKKLERIKIKYGIYR